MITAHDTQTVGNHMIQAIVAQEIQRQKTAREVELEQQVKDLRMENDLLKRRSAAIYTDFIDRDNRWYDADAPRGGVVAAVWWTLVAWSVLAFGALFDALGM